MNWFCLCFISVYSCTKSVTSLQTLTQTVEITQIPVTKVTQIRNPQITQIQDSNQLQDSNQFQLVTPTFYFRVGDNISGCAPVQNFDDGYAYGPCNGGQGVFYNKDSKYWVAISDARDHCGKQIKLYYQGNSIIVTVMDQCPGCGTSKIDMGLEALVELTGSIDIACSINRPQPLISWEFI